MVWPVSTGIAFSKASSGNIRALLRRMLSARDYTKGALTRGSEGCPEFEVTAVIGTASNRSADPARRGRSTVCRGPVLQDPLGTSHLSDGPQQPRESDSQPLPVVHWCLL